MTAEHKYEMTISLQIVEHLGLNLYSNTSAVISEAVANAWDADAKTVEITLEKDCITIKDDGCGMDKYSLQGTTQGNGLTGGVPPVRFSM